MALSAVSSVSALSGASRLTMTQRIDRWALLRSTAAKMRESVEQIDKALHAFDRHDVLSVSTTRTPELDSRTITMRAGTATTLTATEAVNTNADADGSSSFTPTTPSWAGASTSAVTVGGTYAGTTDGTLTFTVSTPGDGDPAARELTVTDGDGAELDRFSLVDSAGDAQQVRLANGLTVDLSDGTLDDGDVFTVDVQAARTTSFDPTKSFDGTGADAPGLDDGLSVTDGSFSLNGTSISVFAHDTLEDVLARINDAALGVTAAYHAGTERVTFTNDAVGTADIELADDTSGFLTALKLNSATSTLGTTPDQTRSLDSVADLSGLQAGTITIDGVAVAVDPANDTLQDVLDRITAETSTTASWHEPSATVRLRAKDGVSSIAVGADQTGLVAALSLHGGVTTSTYVNGPLQRNAYETIGGALATVQQRLTDLRAASSSSTGAKAALYRNDWVLTGLRDRDRQALTALAALPASSSGDDATSRRLVSLRASSDGFASVLRGGVNVSDDGYLDKMRDVFARAAVDMEQEALLLG